LQQGLCLVVQVVLPLQRLLERQSMKQHLVGLSLALPLHQWGGIVLSEMMGSGWLMVEPPEEQDEPSVIARYKGKPIKAGFMKGIVQDNESVFHAVYRSGYYDIEAKIDFDIGRGQLKVTRADGYNYED